MKSYWIPRALYLSSTVPNQPNWDTLIGVCNPFTTPQTVGLHFYDESGSEVPNSPMTRVLQPGHSFATTLIPGNIFPSPPSDFQGYGKVMLPDSLTNAGLPLPVTVCLGGNGPSPMNWNYLSPNVPLIGSPQVSSGPMTRCVFPYLIPYFVDANQHAGEHEYRTGLSITNMDTGPAVLTIRYTVGDPYPNAGQAFETTVTIPFGQSLVKQIHELLPDVLEFNSEGWLDITSATPVSIMAYLLASNRDYNYFGFGQTPWILS